MYLLVILVENPDPLGKNVFSSEGEVKYIVLNIY